jgi:dolichol-phosphate mannosyltransferase
LGLLTMFGGSACLVYLTLLKAQGHAIGNRPLLILGVLLVVVGIQLLSIGLIGEMITSLHEERADERTRSQAVVDEVLTH